MEKSFIFNFSYGTYRKDIAFLYVYLCPKWDLATNMINIILRFVRAIKLEYFSLPQIMKLWLLIVHIVSPWRYWPERVVKPMTNWRGQLLRDG